MNKRIEAKTSPIKVLRRDGLDHGKKHMKAKAGPKHIDDRDSLMEMAKLILGERVKSDHEAAILVAENNPGHGVEATSKRLYRKFRERKQFYLDNAIQLPLVVNVLFSHEVEMKAVQLMQDSDMDQNIYNERFEKELFPWAARVKNIVNNLVESGKEWELIAYCVPTICETIWDGQEVNQDVLVKREQEFLEKRVAGNVPDISSLLDRYLTE
jgi:hypothetical protein